MALREDGEEHADHAKTEQDDNNDGESAFHYCTVAGGIAGRNWTEVAETEPSLLVVPETMTVEPIETSLIAPLTLLETVVAGVMRTTCELPSRVSSVMLPESAAATATRRHRRRPCGPETNGRTFW